MSFCRHLVASLQYNKQNVGLSILSLIVAIAVFSTVFIYVKWDFSHNRVWPGYENIHRVIMSDDPVIGFRDFFFEPDILQLDGYIAGLVSGVTHVGFLDVELKESASLLDPDNRILGLHLHLVDESFLDFFPVETVQGDLSFAISTPGYVALEQREARALFGSDAATVINQTVTIALPDDVVLPSEGPGLESSSKLAREFTVAAIYKLPSPITSSTQFRALTQKGEYAWLGMPEDFRFNRVWVQPENRDSIDVLNSTLNQYATITREGDTSAFLSFTGSLPELSIQALSDIYYAQSNDPLYSESPVGNAPRTVVIALVGLLVLITGCGNSVSLGLTHALEQLKSTGIRKAFGATQRQILLLNLASHGLLVLLALFPAIAISEFLVNPMATQLTGSSENIDIGISGYLPQLVLVACCLALANSLFPGLFLAKLKPTLLLGSSRLFEGFKDFGVRVVLVGLQFAAAIFLVTLCLALVAQWQLLEHRDLGFDADNLLLVAAEPGISMNTEALVEGIRQLPSVLEVGESATGPQNINVFGATQLVREGRESFAAEVQINHIGFNFFEVMKTPFLAGRDFIRGRDVPGQSEMKIAETRTYSMMTSVILTESAVRSLGFSTPEEAIGQTVNSSTYLSTFSTPTSSGQSTLETVYAVIGVVMDSAYYHLAGGARPDGYILSPARSLLVRYDSRSEDILQQEIADVWLERTGALPVSYLFIDDMVRATFAVEVRIMLFLILAAVFTIVLASVGLYGLVSATLSAQSKFIAVRSVFGASIGHIMTLYCFRFSKPILFAIFVGSPAALVFIFRWIEQFPFQLGKPWLILLSLTAAITILLLSWGVVCLSTAIVMHRKPARVLRYE